MSTQKLLHQQDRDTRKKNQSTAPVTLSILRALDPARPETNISSIRSQPEERYTVSDSGHSYRDKGKDAGEKKEKRSFWHARDKEREKESERGREREIILQREKDSQREKDRSEERGRDRLEERKREIWAEEESTTKLTHMIGDWKLHPTCVFITHILFFQVT